jgi:hypothetical protein
MFASRRGQQDKNALIDSGATENFINYKTAIKLHLGEKRLLYPHQVFNIDGTKNQAGSVTSYCILQIYVGGKHVLQQFYITDLGEDTFILGYSWLHHFNPHIDWAKGQVKDGAVCLETPWLVLWMKTHQKSVVKHIQEHNGLDLGDEILVVHKTHIAQEWAIAANEKKKTLTEQDMPEEFDWLVSVVPPQKKPSLLNDEIDTRTPQQKAANTQKANKATQEQRAQELQDSCK